ncbi:MAG TPA: rhodanese-like domain-containing protein [Mycobacteriales bacterium]|nr:rhodanese-like domain-containing protein [Mycobacteriales bacterium]
MREVDISDLDAAIATGAVVVDVRQPEEYAQARVPSAQLIPLGELSGRVGEVPAGEPVYVICAAGVRSLKGAEILIAAGRDAVSVAGGTNAWLSSGRPVEGS